MFRSKNLAQKKELLDLKFKFVRLHRQLVTGIELQHDNPTYHRGWQDAIKFVQSSLNQPRPQGKSSKARQSSFTHRTNNDPKPPTA